MFKIIASCYDAMIQDAQGHLPNEACGLLSGKGEAATAFYNMRNSEESPVSYLMDPQEQFRVMKMIRFRGERLLGIYHSHVATQAYPSAKDVNLAFYPDVHYVIVSLEDRGHPVARAFRIEEGNVREKPIEIIS